MKMEWNQFTWYSGLVAAVLFVGVVAFGWHVQAEFSKIPLAQNFQQGIVGTPISPVAIEPIIATSSATPATQTNPPVVTPTTPSVTQTTPTTPAVSPTTPSNPPAQAGESRFTGYITAYGWPDNTPPGSAAVSNPVLHQLAGGVGTYADPITIAVGHSIIDGEDYLDYPKGTRFYIPNLRKYFIVEDTCGDGNTPQNGPCHTGYQGHPWLDVWVGGEGASTSAVYACQKAITGLYLVIQAPAPNYAVVSGPVFNNTCAKQFGNTVVSS